MVLDFMPTTLHAAHLVLAWILAVYLIYIQGAVVRRIREAERDAGVIWWFGGSLCLGTCVWLESFIATLSIHLPISHGYVLAMVVAAWLPSVMACGASIWLSTHTRVPQLLYLSGSVVVGLALGAVLMLVVSSILLKPAVHWEAPWLALGGGMLLVAGCVGLEGGRRLLRRAPMWQRDLGLAALVASLYGAGQWALLHGARFPASAQPLGEDMLSGDRLAPILGGVTLLLLGLVHLGTRLDERHRRRQAHLSESLARARQDLHQASHRDHLTQLYNRLGFDAQLTAALESGARRLAVMLVNLDGFKPMISHFGHAVGDNLLRQVGARLQSMAGGDDVVARAEGDEFLLLIGRPGDAHALAQCAQRVSEVIREPFLFEEGEIELSCSIGVSLYPDEANPLRLVDHANEAMLAARNAGGAVYCLFESGMERVVEHQVALQRDLRHAIARQELALHYQPKIAALSGQLCGVEALLRWRHPQRGMVSPAEFIPVAERFGLIGTLGAWVLNEACRQARAWMDEGVEVPVAVNVSVHQLHQADLERQVRQALEAHRVPARMLVLEITESVAMENIDVSLKVFDMLDRIGVQLSIDDFGTGYSSLSYLRRLPARQIKIDRCFVRDLDGQAADAHAIVEAVVRLAHALNLTVVAEGVETEAQARWLRAMGCDELQGFLFARPMPEVDLLAWQVQRQTGARLVAEDAPVAVVTDVAAPRSRATR